MSFFGSVALFLRQQEQFGKSAYSLRAYRSDLAELQQLLPDLCAPRAKDFLLAVQKLTQKGQSPKSIARKLSTWRQYCAFLVKQGALPNNPAEAVKAPRQRERLPKAIAQETINQLLDQSAPETALQLRDVAMFELLYGSGLRLGELHALNLSDVQLGNGWVHVLGKGGKERQVPLGSKSIAALRDYLAVRIAKTGETALFTSQRGTRLSTRHIAQRLADWAKLQGSPQHISPHMLRHSFASHVLQDSRDIRAVQDLLGHSSLSSTQIYTKLDFAHLARVYDESHPRAKRKK